MEKYEDYKDEIDECLGDSSSTSANSVTNLSTNRCTGFNFDFYQRNISLAKANPNFAKMPRTLKTGTTIAGVVCSDCVVLGADTRSTTGNIVADKNCEKIHYIAPNIYCCGAGTAADTEATTALIASKLALHRLSTGRQSRITTAECMLRHYLFKYGGYVGAHLILGGIDVNGPQLYMIHNYGSGNRLPYATMGSGSLAAMSVLETGYRDAMTMEEGMALVKRAIEAGILNDMGSGGNIDLVVVHGKGTATVHRNIARPKLAGRSYWKPGGFAFPKGTTEVISRKVTPIVDDDVKPAVPASPANDVEMA